MVTLASGSESEESYNNIGLQCDFEFEPTASSFQTSNAQKRRKIVNTRITEQNEMPASYQHLRESIQKVRPEVYEAIDKMKSDFQMSERQAEGAVMIVENKLFDRKWKLHTKNEESLDLDTLPHQRTSGK